MTERETESGKKEKKDKKKSKFSVITAAFEELLKKIEELISKQTSGQISDQEKDLLQECQQETRQRKNDFLKTDFGQKTTTLAEKIDQRLNQALQEFNQASAEELSDKIADIQGVLLAEQTKAIRHITQEAAANLEARLEGIAKTDLERLLQEKQRQIQQLILQKQGQTPSVSRPNTNNQIDSMINAIINTIPEGVLTDEQRQELAQHYRQNPQALQQERRRMDQARRGISQGIDDDYQKLFDPEYRKTLQDPIKGAEERERIFNEHFQIFDTLGEGQFTQEVFRMMGLKELNKWSEFLNIIGGIKGREGQEIRNTITNRMKMKLLIHDGIAIIEQGAGKPENLQQMMERFGPELFDQLFKEKGAELAARLYETGVNTFRSRDKNWVWSEKMFKDPDKGNESDINRWVQDRFEEIMIAKIKREHNLTDEQARERYQQDWEDSGQTRRAMALGKGYEMITLQLPAASARGRLPVTEKIPVSPAYENFVRCLDPGTHFMRKFQDGDEAANFLLYVVSGGKVMPWAHRKEIEEFFQLNREADPDNLALIDIVNFLRIGGPFVQSGWRGEMAMRDIAGDVRDEWLGLSFSLAQVDHDYVGKYKGKSKAELTAIKKRIFERELKRNPITILREAELQDGEILDSKVVEKVIAQTLSQLSPAERQEYQVQINQGKQGRDEFLNQAEMSLITLTQLEIEARKGAIDFDQISDPKQRKLAEAYYKAICKVVNQEDQRTWIIDKGKKKQGTLLDYLAQKKYPFAPIMDDVPWSEFHFRNMGQMGFARRLRDYAAADTVMKGLAKIQTQFPMLRTPEQIVGAVGNEIWSHMRDYTKSNAREMTAQLYEGMARFNAANWTKRFLPIPLDSFMDFVGDNIPGFKGTSYAKQVYGYPGLSWRGIDLRNFLAHARAAGHINKEQERELKRKLKCTFGWLLLEYSIRVPLIGAILVGFAALKELWQQLEEQAKQS